MNPSTKRLKWGRIALWSLIVGGVAIAACETPVRNDTKLNGFGISFKTITDVNGNMTNDVTGSLPPGKCLEITYRGADGSVTGGDTIGVPGSSQIPPGSTSQSFRSVDCPPQEEQGIGWPRIRQAPPLYIDIFGGPIVLDYVDGGIFKNAVYKFRVMNPGGSAWDEILPILTGGPGTPISPKVQVLSFTQTLPESLGARIRAGDTSEFADFRLDWNGTHGYADLASGTNAIQYDAPNGWNVVEAFVSAADILPFGQQNVATTTRRTVSEVQSHSLTGKIIYYP